MKNILITQKAYKNKHGSLNWSIENNWYEYFKSKKINLIPLGKGALSEKELSCLKPKALIMSGGNSPYEIEKNNENFIREKNDKIIFRFAAKKKIPILAICGGFQRIASFYKSKIIKINHHVKKFHLINVEKKIFNIKIGNIKINSYHNYAIKKLPKHFNMIVKCKDNSIELAYSKDYNILCLMFHPERFNPSQNKINKIVFSHLKIK